MVTFRDFHVNAIRTIGDRDVAALMELILKYRKGRDGFDGLALEVTRLYAEGRLLPAVVEGEEQDLTERLNALAPEDVKNALEDNLGTIPLSREEHEELIADITAFVKEWLHDVDL